MNIGSTLIWREKNSPKIIHCFRRCSSIQCPILHRWLLHIQHSFCPSFRLVVHSLWSPWLVIFHISINTSNMLFCAGFQTGGQYGRRNDTFSLVVGPLTLWFVLLFLPNVGQVLFFLFFILGFPNWLTSYFISQCVYQYLIGFAHPQTVGWAKTDTIYPGEESFLNLK